MQRLEQFGVRYLSDTHRLQVLYLIFILDIVKMFLFLFFCLSFHLYVLNLLVSAPRAGFRDRFPSFGAENRRLDSEEILVLSYLGNKPTFYTVSVNVHHPWLLLHTSLQHLTHNKRQGYWKYLCLYVAIVADLYCTSHCFGFGFVLCSMFSFNLTTSTLLNSKYLLFKECFCWCWSDQQAPVCCDLLLSRQVIKASSWKSRPAGDIESCWIFLCSHLMIITVWFYLKCQKENVLDNI